LVSSSNQGTLHDVTYSLGNVSIDGGHGGDGSGNSVNRLIETIQNPSQVEAWSPDDSNNAPAANTILDQGQAVDTAEDVDSQDLSDNLQQELDPASPPLPGTVNIAGSGQPLRASRIQDELQSPAVDTDPRETEIIPGNNDQPLLTSSEAPSAPHAQKDNTRHPEKLPSANGMRVLVAEDDPVNSRIIDKRLTKLGHKVHLTKNGEECAHVYCEEQGRFDIVLMDIQVRSPETHPDLTLFFHKKKC
jgi:hypothetical protein